jgi:hypothetical protein
METPILTARRAPADWIERTALSASLLCLVHCLALPLVLAAFPVLSRVFSLPETIHLWLLAFAAPTSALALVLGRMRHGALLPLLIGGIGVSLLALGALWFIGTSAETPLTVVGSLLLASAHIANWRLRHGAHCHV